MIAKNNRVFVIIISYFLLSLAGYKFLAIYRLLPLQIGLTNEAEVISMLVTHLLFANYTFTCYFLGWLITRQADRRLKIMVSVLATVVVIVMYVLAVKISLDVLAK